MHAMVASWIAEAEAERRAERRMSRRLKKTAGLPAPVIVRGFLSEADMQEIFKFAREMQVEDDGGALVRYGDAHIALFLHHGGLMHDDVWRSFATGCPALLERMLAAARQHAADGGLCAAAVELNVRCVELHQYTAGGGLTDPGHCDQGSAITFSVMLSAAGPSSRGGRFSTTDGAGATTVHELERGDAIIFCSEMVHNVSQLREGERNSLVVELWRGPTNRKDRFS